jgi:nucleoporin POM152
MSPISTAQLNPDHLTFCLSQTGSSVLVPVLLNNTDVSYIKYSLTPLGYRHDLGELDKVNKAVGKVEHHELSKRELRVIQQVQEENARLSRPTVQAHQDSPDYDEYDDDEDDDESEQKHNTQSTLQKTQSLQYIRISKPGVLRLERVLDTSNIDARILYSLDVTVAPCPRVEFANVRATSAERDIRCHGHDKDLDLTIDIYGVPPLALRWFKEINGRREHFLVEGIEGGHGDHRSPSEAVADGGGAVPKTTNVPQNVKVPLSVSLDTLGNHLYALEEIMDGVGNVLRFSDSLFLDSSSPINTKTAQSLTVIRRPSFSFQGCRPGTPTPLLIGSEAPVTVSAIAADSLDGPWELLMKYVPPAADESGKATKRYKPWKRTGRTPAGSKELTMRVNAPGEYTLLGVKGKARPSRTSDILSLFDI